MTTTQSNGNDVENLLEQSRNNRSNEEKGRRDMSDLESKNNKELRDSQLLTAIFRINSEESLARNRKFLKDLELTKARLRTYAAYTPTDRELQQRAAEYRKRLQKRIGKSFSS